MSALVVRIKEMLASFLTYLRCYFHRPTLLVVGSTEPQQPQQPAPLDIESGGDALPTDDQQINGVSMRDLVLPLTICASVYPSIPPSELLVSGPLHYSPLLASVCLAVLAAGLSLVNCHGRRIRWLVVGVASSVFAYLLRILLTLPGESLVPVVVLLSFGIGLGAVYVWLNPSQQHNPNSSPETNI